ncbi:hypothetical protein EP331_06025 [bacterium]|nr:MAG: hypothetical protein EP331_06025 [bacterium]
MSNSFVKDFFWGLFFLVLQVVLVRHLRLFEAEANLLWLYMIFIAATNERTYTIITVSVLALLHDALLDTWGVYLFANVLVIFVIYNFLPRISENKLLTGQVFVLLTISSLLMNGLILLLSSFIQLYGSDVFFWQTLIGNSLYTALLGSFLYNFSSAAKGNV